MSERKEFDNWLNESQFALASITTKNWLLRAWMARSNKAKRDHERLVEALRDLVEVCPISSNTLGSYQEARALLATLEAEKGGSCERISY